MKTHTRRTRKPRPINDAASLIDQLDDLGQVLRTFTPVAISILPDRELDDLGEQLIALGQSCASLITFAMGVVNHLASERTRRGVK